MDPSQLDPYKVFKVPKDFALDDVKRKYRRLAVKLHPDKNPGDPRAAGLFHAISHCYQQLLEDYCTRTADRQFSELKQESRAAAAMATERRPTQPASAAASEPRFDLETFNRVFEEHRQRDVLDEGYGRWMQDTPAEKEVAERMRTRLSVSLHTGQPTALQTTAPGTTYELGMQRVQDYSAPVVSSHGRRAGLVYTDYRLAHTTTRLVDSDDPDRIRRSFANVQQLQQHRAEKRDMTEEEAAEEAERQERERAAEEARLQRLRRRDVRAAQHFERVHSLLRGGTAAPALER